MKKKETFLKKYMEFELMEGRAPHSVFEFCKANKITEATFYEQFNSLEQIRKYILVDCINPTLELLDNDEAYDGFSAREKLLALFYSLFEQFKSHRSYLIHRYDKKDNWQTFSTDWEAFFRQFIARVELILQEGKSTDEVKERPYISAHYAKGYKLIFTYVFRVWVKDESDQFTTTDAAIEKAVNLSFELLGNGPLDALIDFGRFAVKTKVI